jgi:pilus assembly protein CpaF
MFGLRRQKPVVESGVQGVSSAAGSLLSPVGISAAEVMTPTPPDTGSEWIAGAGDDSFGSGAPAVPWQAITDPAREQEFQQRKMRLHESLVEAINLKFAAGADEDASRRMFRTAVATLIHRTFPSESASYLERMSQELVDEAEGLGPLECLVRDDSITDVLVNNPHEVYVERHGVLEKTPVVFADTAHLLRVAQRLTARVGRRVDESNPMVDARLPDGSRLNVTIPPLAIDGATISIRRFPKYPFTLPQLILSLIHI